MRTSARFLALFALGVVPHVIAGQTQPNLVPQLPNHFVPSEGSLNAAERYMWIAGQKDFASAKPALDSPDASGNPEARAIAVQIRDAWLVRNQEWIEQVAEATKLERCSFDLSLDPLQTYFPAEDPRHKYLESMKTMLRVLQADAESIFHRSERVDSATDRYVAMIGLCRHLASDSGSSLHHLAATSLIALAVESIDGVRRELSPQSRASILHALDRLDPTDPGGLLSAQARDAKAFLTRIHRGLKDNSLDPELEQELRDLRRLIFVKREMLKKDSQLRFLGDPELFKQERDMFLATLSPLTHDSIAAAADRATTLQSEVAAAFAMPDAEARLSAIEAQIDADDTGVSMLVLSSPKNLHRSAAEVSEKLRSLKSGLQPAGAPP